MSRGVGSTEDAMPGKSTVAMSDGALADRETTKQTGRATGTSQICRHRHAG